MPKQPTPPWIQREQINDLAIVRFTQSVILSGKHADVVGAFLDDLMEEPGCPRLVVNLANVQSLTSLVLGKLAGLHRRAREIGGRLVLCEPDPIVREILDVVGLSRLMSVYETEQEAVQSFAGG